MAAHEWQITIHRSERGKVTLEVKEDESMGGAITFVGRVPIWNDLPPRFWAAVSWNLQKG